ASCEASRGPSGPRSGTRRNPSCRHTTWSSSPWRCQGGSRSDELCDPYAYFPSPTTTVMWLVRLRMRVPRPLARAMKRFNSGPSSTVIVAILSSSMSAPALFSALAMADSTSFLISAAAFLSENLSRLTARSAGRPRTWSATRRAFCGEMRAVRSTAVRLLASVRARLVSSCLARFALSMVRSLPARLLVATVTLEGPGEGEFAELVANHVLVDQHRDVIAAVVDGDREAHHFRQDHRTARPGLDRLLGVARRLDLLDQVMVDERALLE